MSILNLEHITKHYGEKALFDDISCGVEAGERVGIIGVNGTGKSTLLKIMAGKAEPDSGKLVLQNGIRLAYLPQEPQFEEGDTLLSAVLAGAHVGQWHAESEAKTILTKLGFTGFEEPVDQLSGGQRKKAALARVLLDPADILLLDEPTNHLDNEMLAWLEAFLQKTKKTVVMVTHDRYFLDQVSTRIFELDHGRLYDYPANYSKFLELKAERAEMELASERKRRSVLRMELEWAKRGCRARTTKQKARLDRLEALKRSGTNRVLQQVELETVGSAAGTRMGKKTIEFHHVRKVYGERVLIDDFDYIVLRGQRLGFIGPNGCGKSTLMKLLCGMEQPTSGTIEIGETVKIGYFAQTSEEMKPSERVIDYIRDTAEYIQTSEGRMSASALLERFLFTPEMQYTEIGRLSGGERRRLQLLRVLAEAPNVLVLDEPTNDLDIPTLTILEDYLSTFSGIVITVSHDRYFLDDVVDRIFAFEANGKLKQYEGGYTDYLEKQALSVQGETEDRSYENRSTGDRSSGEQPSGKNRTGSQQAEKGREVSGTKKASEDWKKDRRQKLKFSFQEQREYQTIEADIDALQEKLDGLDAMMQECASQYTKLSELSAQKEAAEQALSEKMDRWVYLSELAEKIEAQKER